MDFLCKKHKILKKPIILKGDVVLVSLRDYQDEKCDVVHKYLPEEVRSLKALSHIPESIVVEEEGGDQNNNDVDVAFQDSDEEEKGGEEVKKDKKRKDLKDMDSEDSDDELNDVINEFFIVF